MLLQRCLGIKKEDICKKIHNIWIGISLGNAYFTKEHIKEYILWALDNTADSVLIVIADRIHAINIEVLDGYKKKHAFDVALRKGDEKEQEVRDIIKELPASSQKMIHIAKFREMTNTKYHDYRLEVLFDAYKNDHHFHEYIVNIVYENSKVAYKSRTIEEIDNLATYVLRELPVFLNGAKIGGLPEYGGKTYSLIPYPGLGLIDELLIGLQEKTLFPDLAEKLYITDPIAIVEAYCEG